MENKNSFESERLFKKYILLSLTLIFFLPCLFFSPLDEIVTVDGEIRPEIYESSVESRFSGVITNVNFKNSQFVNKGDILFEFDSSYENQQLGNLKELKILYQNEENELLTLLKLLDKTSIKMLPVDAEINYINSKCTAFISEYKRYMKNLETSKCNYERMKPLFPQAVSKSELEDYENSYLQDIYIFLSWLENYKIQSREKYSEITQSLQNCQIQIMQLNRDISNSRVSAPISGLIHEIKKIKPGDYIYSRTNILTIIPDSTNLKCIAFVPSTNISKIKIGQEAIVQITDLPWTKYGKLIGQISLIPPDVIHNTSVSEKNGFPVEIKLSKNYLQDKNEKFFLHVGSSGKVRIKISTNTIFQKFLEKVVLND